MSSLNSRGSWNYGTALGRVINGGVEQSSGRLATITETTRQGVVISNGRVSVLYCVLPYATDTSCAVQITADLLFAVISKSMFMIADMMN